MHAYTCKGGHKDQTESLTGSTYARKLDCKGYQKELIGSTYTCKGSRKHNPEKIIAYLLRP